MQCYKQEKRSLPAPAQYPPESIAHWVPLGLAERLQSKGVKQLFPWQVECLQRPAVLEGRTNLVFCAPTSGGKSLVAELLLVRSVLVHRRRTLYVVPYISIVQEKTQYLQDWLAPILKVEGLSSDRKCHTGDKSWHPFIDITVCTIEKACSIVNHLLEEHTPDRLGCVAVDEVHMLGEGERGGLLEALLIKLKLLQCQVVAMSATLPEAEGFAQWLQAEFYRGSFRPVPLQHYLVQNGVVYDAKREVIRCLNCRDSAAALAKETAEQGNQAILFCPSKQACESVAMSIAGKLPVPTSASHQQMMEEASKLEELAPVLRMTLPRGAAFHHADLPSKERLFVEKYYRLGAIQVLTATSTLAAGVNLPANRVIITAPYMGSKPLTCRNYQQMSGRAGRTDTAKTGESFLLVNKTSEKLGRHLLQGELEPILSNLCDSALKRAIIDGFAIGKISDPETFAQYLSHSYRSVKDNETLQREGQVLLQQLQQTGMVSDFQCTPVLKATFASMLPPEVGATLTVELVTRGTAAFCTNRLFWLYLSTPRDFKPGKVNWWSVLKTLRSLSKEDLEVVALLDIDEDIMARWGAVGIDSSEDTQAYYRFIGSLALYIRLGGTELRHAAEQLELSAGLLQSLEVQVETMTGMLGVYCQRLGLWAYAAVFNSLQDRLSRICSETELQPLLALPCIKPFRAKQLYAAGITDPGVILALDTQRLEEVLLRCESKFQLEGGETRSQYKELAQLMQRQAVDWSDSRNSVTEASELSADEETEEVSADVEPLVSCLSTYIESSLEVDEYVALLQEAVSAI